MAPPAFRLSGGVRSWVPVEAACFPTRARFGFENHDDREWGLADDFQIALRRRIDFRSLERLPRLPGEVMTGRAGAGIPLAGGAA